MFLSLVNQIGYHGLFYVSLAAMPLLVLNHYLWRHLTPFVDKLSARAKLAWLRWQKRGQFAHYTKTTLEKYSFTELYDVTRASLAVADFRTAEHILVHLLAHPEAGRQPDLHLLLGQIYRHYGNQAKAKLVCQQGIRAYPHFYDTYYLLGQILKDNHTYSAALNILQKAVQLDPHRPEAYLLIVEIYQQQRRPQEILALLNRGLDEQPKSLPLLQTKLLTLQRLGHFAPALELAELILASHPHDSTTRKVLHYLRKKQVAKKPGTS